MKLPKITIGKKPTYVKFAQDQDFYALFQRIEKMSKNCFLFESLGEEGKFSRYSIIGFDPEHIIRGRDKQLLIDEKVYKTANPYTALRSLMPEKTIAKNYAGGLVGYLSYEAVNYFDTAVQVKVHKDFDQFTFGVYTDGVILDKLTNELFYFYYTKSRLPLIQKILKKSIKKTTFKATFVENSVTKEAHKEMVAQVLEHIRAGNTFQCEVGFKTKFRITGDPLKIYEKLREVNPSPFMYYLKFDEKKIIGASPELLFGLRENEMETRPLAGTIGRGKTETEDQQLARTLLHDPKEIAEHNMLVDLHRNDIGKGAQFGTVRVKDYMSVKKFSHVQHISSEIVGIIKRGEDMFSTLSYNFPAGTLSGAPKIESMKIIDSLEQEARGPYGGGVGQFGFNGDCTFAIAIRSLFVSGKNAYAQTSGGIVFDSDPEKEYTEVERKLAAMRKVLGV